jgi:uncharacterized DUF497 family protein
VEFEFDATKSEANLAKHGIDFVEAQALWSDESRLEISPNSGRTAQSRHRQWGTSLVGCDHSPEPRIRFISVRRSRIEEIELYEAES